jgi:hypothetical protein
MVLLHFGRSLLTNVSFSSEISLDGEFFFKNPNFGDFLSKTQFIIANFFIHLSKFSSNYDDSIQNMDESAALFISLVPQVR